MLPENQTNKNPSREENKTIPTSMQNSGANLDPCCGEITQSTVPAAMDSYKSSIPEAEATKIINGRKS
ncbi:MAG: hypothetical protein WCC97_14415 [Candidatus Acidiferrales bacterium]